MSTPSERRERFEAKFGKLYKDECWKLDYPKIISFLEEEVERGVREDRERVKEQVDELWTSMEEQKVKTKAGSPARQFCRGATAAYKEILSLLSPQEDITK